VRTVVGWFEAALAGEGILPNERAGELEDIWTDVLVMGARGGHEKMCWLVRDENVAINPYAMACDALANGHAAIFDLALSWAKVRFTLNEMLTEAAVKYDASHGGMRMCELVCSKSDLNATALIRPAAAAGSERLCWKAIEWGASGGFDLMLMLTGAARGGHEALCRVAYANLKRTFNDPEDDEWWSELRANLICAIAECPNRERHEALGRMAFEWGVDGETMFNVGSSYTNATLMWLAVVLDPEVATWHADTDLEQFVLSAPPWSYDELLYFSAEWIVGDADNDNEGDEKDGEAGLSLCMEALARDTRRVDWLLCYGAFHGFGMLCRLAVRRGARDFDGMLMAACAGESPFLAELARKWGAKATPRPATDLRHVRSE
jgi:hypothetical protein